MKIHWLIIFTFLILDFCNSSVILLSVFYQCYFLLTFSACFSIGWSWTMITVLFWMSHVWMLCSKSSRKNGILPVYRSNRGIESERRIQCKSFLPSCFFLSKDRFSKCPFLGFLENSFCFFISFEYSSLWSKFSAQWSMVNCWVCGKIIDRKMTFLIFTRAVRVNPK